MFAMATRWLAAVFFAVALISPASASTEAEVACRKLTEKLLSVPAGACEEVGLNVSSGRSTLGEPLLFRDFTATSRRILPRRVLLIGGTHGDELSSVAVVFDWMKRIERERFQPFYWRVVPCLNPDGFLNSPSIRMNGRGVDLNRNLPTPDWSAKSKLYWEKRTRKDPRRYPGPSAASEPETQWLLEQIKEYRPDVIVSIHAPYGLLDFDGPRNPPRRLGFLALKDLGTYPGSLGSYAGEYLKMPILTLELPEAEGVPTTAQNAKIWADLLGWLEDNLPKGQAPEFQRIATESELSPAVNQAVAERDRAGAPSWSSIASQQVPIEEMSALATDSLPLTEQVSTTAEPAARPNLPPGAARPNPAKGAESTQLR
jgi:hypothetical protein